jgi:uncharacterized protein YcbX
MSSQPNERVGTVATLTRFPVKSMQGEQLATAEVTASGLLGDRAYALVETHTRKVMSGKNPRVGRLLLGCRAAFVEAPHAADEMPAVRITLPDGTAVTSDTGDADATLSGYLGCDVTLQHTAPDVFVIDQYHPDIEDLGPEGHRDTVTESKLGASLFADIGVDSPIPAGSFLDAFPVSVLTSSTLAQLQALGPESRFDARRFRMNMVVDTSNDGFVENEWPGRVLCIGDEVRILIALADPRCVMTTLAQDDLPADIEILRTLVQHNRVDVAGALLPCAGVYAMVDAAGAIRTGDSVSIG